MIAERSRIPKGEVRGKGEKIENPGSAKGCQSYYFWDRYWEVRVSK